MFYSNEKMGSGAAGLLGIVIVLLLSSGIVQGAESQEQLPGSSKPNMGQSIIKGSVEKEVNTLPEISDNKAFALCGQICIWSSPLTAGNSISSSWADKNLYVFKDHAESLPPDVVDSAQIDFLKKHYASTGFNSIPVEIHFRFSKEQHKRYLDIALPLCGKEKNMGFTYHMAFCNKLTPEKLAEAIELAVQNRDKAFYVDGKFVVFTYGASFASPERWKEAIAYCEKKFPDFPVLWIMDYDALAWQDEDDLRKGNDAHRGRDKLEAYLEIFDGCTTWFFGPSLLGQEKLVEQMEWVKKHYPDKLFGYQVVSEYLRDNRGVLRPGFGTKLLRKGFELAFKGVADRKADFLFIPTWDDWTEHHQICPSVKHSFARMDIVKYYLERLKGHHDFRFDKKKIIVSYLSQFLVGQPINIEVLSLPSKAEDVMVELTLVDDAGNVVCEFPEMEVAGGDIEVFNCKISTISLADYDILIPRVRVYKKGSSEHASQYGLKFIQLRKNASLNDLAQYHFSLDKIEPVVSSENLDINTKTFSLSLASQNNTPIESMEMMLGSDRVLYNFKKEDEGREISSQNRGYPLWIRFGGERQAVDATVKVYGGEFRDAKTYETFRPLKIRDRRQFHYKDRAPRTWNVEYPRFGFKVYVSGKEDTVVEIKLNNVEKDNKISFSLKDIITSGGLQYYYYNNKKNFITSTLSSHEISCNEYIGTSKFSTQYKLDDLYPGVINEPVWVRVIFKNGSMYWGKPKSFNIKSGIKRNINIYDHDIGELLNISVDQDECLDETYHATNVFKAALVSDAKIPRVNNSHYGSFRADVLYLGGPPSQQYYFSDLRKMPDIDEKYIRLSPDTHLAWYMGAYPIGPHRFRIKVKLSKLPEPGTQGNCILGVWWGATSLWVDPQGKLFVHRRDYDDVETIDRLTEAAGGKIEPGKWYVVGYNFNVKNIELVINDKVVATAEIPISPGNPYKDYIQPPMAVSIGTIMDKNKPSFSGLIEWFKLYNTESKDIRRKKR